MKILFCPLNKPTFILHFHSFTFIGDSPAGLNGANAPMTSGNLMSNSGNNGNSSPKSEKEAMMAKAYEQLMSSRKNDIPQPVMRQ